MSKKSYQDRYCLFLDILGFQSLVDDSADVKKGDKDTKSLTSLIAALEAIREGVTYKDAVVVSGRLKPSSRVVTQFSDSVIISYKKDDGPGSGLTSIISDVHKLQIEMITRGILLRGAITLGRLFHSESFVLGPALNEAVALERLASYPRVILGPDVLDAAGLKRGDPAPSTRTISSMVAEDFDGMFFVDYFNILPDDFFDDWYEAYHYLRQLREAIRKLSYRKHPSIKLKHSWMRAKFNDMAVTLERNEFGHLGAHSIPAEDRVLFSGIKKF